MRLTRVVLYSLGVLVIMAASGGTLWAQPIGLPVNPGQTPPDKELGGLTVFVSADGGLTPYIATYEGSGFNEGLVGAEVLGTDLSFELEEREQQLLYIGGTVGARYSMDTMHFTAGFGVSYLELQQQNNVQSPPGVGYNNEHQEFQTLTPNPGFSAILGFDWEAYHNSHVSLILGLQALYTSAFGLRGTSLDGTDTSRGGPTNGDRLEYTRTDTTDLSMHLITFQPHVGAEWRPVGSLAVNSFGLFSALTLSAGSMTKRLRTASESFGTVSGGTMQDSELTLDLSMSPIQIMGGYYGWYFAVPHFGTIGLEAQFGARWNAELSYQYSF